MLIGGRFCWPFLYYGPAACKGNTEKSAVGHHVVEEMRCFIYICEKHRVMLEILSHTDPCSSGRKIHGRHNLVRAERRDRTDPYLVTASTV